MIRQLEEKDWSTVKEWLFEIGRNSFDNFVPSFLEKKLEGERRDFPERFVVSEDDELNGVLWFEANPERKSVFIHAIYVPQKYRGAGVSDQLIDYLEEYCKERSITTIDLNVTTNLEAAIKFYKRRGFQVKRYQMSKGL